MWHLPGFYHVLKALIRDANRKEAPGAGMQKRQSRLYLELIKLFNQMLDAQEGDMLQVKKLKLEIFK